MNIEEVGLYIFAIVSAVYLLHLGLYLVGANFYDLWHLKHKARRTPQKSWARSDLPLVTVAVPAHNEEQVIIRCLDSIRKSNYPKLQVLVVDDASQDNTYQYVQSYIKRYPKFNLGIVRRYKNVGKGLALNYALKNYAMGELVMTIDADSLLRKDAISNAIAYFSDPTVVGVAANVRIIQERSILGILQLFEHMIAYRSKKLHSLTNCEFIVGGVASTYRMDVLREVGFYDADSLTEDVGLSLKVASQGNRSYRLLYAADVVAMTEGVASFPALLRQRFRWKYGSLQSIIKYYRLIGNTSPQFTLSLTLYRLPMAVIGEFTLLSAPLIWTFVIYMTLTQRSLWLIAGAYITVTTYTYITLWFDEHTKPRQCLKLSLYVPFVYLIFYIMDLVQLVSAIRCLKKLRPLLERKDSGSVWVSPKRIGREMQTE